MKDLHHLYTRTPFCSKDKERASSIIDSSSTPTENDKNKS